MPAAYSFVSEWRTPASPARCWGEVERMLLSDRGTSWWPAVGVDPRPASLAVGESLGLRVRSPLGYVLRVRLLLTGVEEGRMLSATSDGDLKGFGSLMIAERLDGARLTWEWRVTTQPRWMNATAFALAPLFRGAHRRVMAAGERGMLRALATDG